MHADDEKALALFQVRVQTTPFFVELFSRIAVHFAMLLSLLTAFAELGTAARRSSSGCGRGFWCLSRCFANTSGRFHVQHKQLLLHASARSEQRKFLCAKSAEFSHGRFCRPACGSGRVDVIARKSGRNRAWWGCSVFSHFKVRLSPSLPAPSQLV